jgi:glycosyltransferase involved in cell wall biosynthesis
MRVAVFHALFSELGGGEVFAVNLGRALSELGFDVDFYTFELNPNFRNVLGGIPGRLKILKKPLYVDLLEGLSSGRFVRLRRLLLYKYLAEILDEISRSYDLTIETQSNIPYSTDISYIHFPALIDYVLWSSRGSMKTFILRQAYNSILNHLLKQLCRLGRPKLILTNSSWTAKWVLRAYGGTSPIKVLHPPVDVEYFLEVANEDMRENLIITISRFTPEKNLGEILKIAKSLKDHNFLLVGSVSKYSKPVIENLRNYIESEGLENVILKFNVPRNELREILSKAKYYLHPPFPEHFGIAVVEAMAAGCIPIVYKDGGVWYDIVSRVSDVLGYRDVNEVPNIIRNLDSNKDLYITLRSRSIEISKEFSYENFKNNLSKWVDYILKIKKSI